MLLLLPKLPAVLLLLALNLIYRRGDPSTAVVSRCLKRKSTHAARKDGARTVEAHLGDKNKSGVATVSLLGCVGCVADEGSHERRSKNRRTIRCWQRSRSASVSLSTRTTSKRAQALLSHVPAPVRPRYTLSGDPLVLGGACCIGWVLRDERLWFGEQQPKRLLWGHQSCASAKLASHICPPSVRSH